MTISPSLTVNSTLDDPVDEEIAGYLNPKEPRSFFLFAGAGSGKTRTLVNSLDHIRSKYERELTLHGHRVGVITYTNAARDEIIRRTDSHPLFYVATIHSFAWELIKGFDHDIREWLRKNLQEEIDELQIKEDKGRSRTKASIERQAKIKSKGKQLERLDAIQSFIYSPNGENSESNALNHAEVIQICADFLSQKPLMGWILVGRFPILLIDESQDTNRHLIGALFTVDQRHSDRFCLGLIGDVMQRIYQDGKEHIEEELPERWGRPSKRLNHRCPKRVVRLINKIRETADEHTQEARSDALNGKVRLFIRRADVTDHTAIEEDIRSQMAEYSGDAGWGNRDQCKILTLEHHMAARRLKFEAVFKPLYKIDGWRTGLLDGSLPLLRFFTQLAFPLVQAQQKNDRFTVFRLIRQSSPLLTRDALKEASDPKQLMMQAQAGVDALMSLCGKGTPTCADVLRCILEHELFEIPEVLLSAHAVLDSSADSSQEDMQADPLDERTAAVLSFLEAPFSEIDIYQKYIDGLTAFDTHQGVKGLEFERVMVIMDDSESRGFMFSYGKLLGDRAYSRTDISNLDEGRDSSIDRTRRLFYVACSRSKSSLALVAYAENPDKVKDYVLRNDWFAEEEVDIA
ncbi:MAG: ATP-dependent helicase [Gammaproteobacteria bacterium AqS3]|nr:ATP-dependent helicase [Gammaproteobacteria bacterium AqS3]